MGILKINLPQRDFTLPALDRRRLDGWVETTARLRQIEGQAGRGDGYRAVQKRLRALYDAGEHPGFSLSTNLELRAYAGLLNTDEEFARAAGVTADVANHIQRTFPHVGRLATLEFLSAYFRHFASLPDLGSFAMFCSDLVHMQATRGGGPKGILRSLMQHRNPLFRTDGPVAVVDHAVRSGIELETVITDLGLGDHVTGRFVQACHALYYVERLKALAPNEDSALLEEVATSKVREAKLNDQRLIGHEVISVMIDTCRKVGMEEVWCNTILAIADDPRVPKRSASYQKWWQLIDIDDRHLMEGWLSRVDLELFLKILEEFGNTLHNQDHKRMFPERARFMRGLFQQGLIAHTRLFLSQNADRFVRHQYRSKDDLPNYAVTDDADISVIYLKLKDGRGHIIEGTHSFTIRIYDDLPPSNGVLNYDLRQYGMSQLRKGLAEKYMAEWNQWDFLPDSNGLTALSMPVGVRHSSNIRWQAQVIRVLEKLGHKIDKEYLFTPRDWLTFRREYL